MLLMARHSKVCTSLLAVTVIAGITRNMAWFSHGDSDNESLIKSLRNNDIVKHEDVINAMVGVDRAHFVDQKSWAYMDSPSSIGYGATISAPHMHGYALDLLREHLSHPNAKVLDVGSGSGYLAACFAKFVEPHDGLCVGIEHIPELVEKSKANIATQGDKGSLQYLINKGTLKLVCGDGYAGYVDDAPYDCIHVGAAAAEIPKALIEQLKPNGRLVIPVGKEGGMQQLAVVDKSEDGEVLRRDVMGVMYVPLTSKDHQLQSSRYR